MSLLFRWPHTQSVYGHPICPIYPVSDMHQMIKVAEAVRQLKPVYRQTEHNVVSTSQVCGADSQDHRLIIGFCSYLFPLRVWPIKTSLHTGVNKLSVGGLLQYFLIALAQFSQQSFNEENSEPNRPSRFFPLNTKSCPECNAPHVQSSEYRPQFLFCY